MKPCVLKTPYGIYGYPRAFVFESKRRARRKAAELILFGAAMKHRKRDFEAIPVFIPKLVARKALAR